ncbi:hypothetical protein I3843_11G191500 [Carya illinoinensis]|nr:hypothetical protein I3843_11G191500 [Carya illinoinensis]
MATTDYEELAQAIASVFNGSNPNNSGKAFTNLNAVLQELKSKLGLDLSHKLDFIRSQIHFLFRSQPPPSSPPKDHFALHPNPNFHPSPLSSAIQSFSSQPLPQPAKLEAPAAVVADAPTLSAPTKATKRKGCPGGPNKLCGVSPELQIIVGQPALPRTEIVKQLKIICNDELQLVFETDCTDMFKMNKLLAKQFLLNPLSGSKKAEVDVDSAMKSSESGPSVIISEALANFFGVGEREMLQSEVLRRIWEYINLNNLEDPSSSMSIHCDTKLQKLFGCESISALGIPEVLVRHHIFRGSC